jgi:hypothetical protein
MEAAFKKVEKARPASGINLSEVYYYGDVIQGTITLTDDFISDAAREHFNATNLSEYSISECVVFIYVDSPLRLLSAQTYTVLTSIIVFQSSPRSISVHGAPELRRE